jgi:cyclic 2,3-diphosphoglycerate synthetase
VIFDGSGAAIPPLEVGARVLVTSASQPPEVAAGYLNAYRILVSDLVIVTGGVDDRLIGAIREVKDLPIVPVELRPRPVEPVVGRRVAYFSTAPAYAHEAIEQHLRSEQGADVALVSGNLARREALREEVARADAEVFLVEIKAAAIDVVAEAALERGVEVVFADNELVPAGVLDLDTELVRLADEAIARETVAQ